MKCPKCGSEKILICTNKCNHPYQRHFECVDCAYQSRTVEVYKYRCINYKSEWEIELDKLEQEWQ